MTGREGLLAAFDRLFDEAATKLNATCSDDERATARSQFEGRMGEILAVVDQLEIGEIPEQVMTGMVDSIRTVSPAELSGILASIPLARQAQTLARAVLVRQAEQRLLEQMAMQADTRYGGN